MSHIIQKYASICQVSSVLLLTLFLAIYIQFTDLDKASK